MKLIEIKDITRENLPQIENDLLKLEPDWIATGESEWNSESLKKEIPGKFDGLSKYAVYDGNLVGYLIASVDRPGVGKLNKIVTKTNIRGKGIGSQLWTAFLDTFRSKGFHKLEFRALTDNPVLSFYEKRGCVFDGYTLGTDKKLRQDIYYTLKTTENIPHSMPTIGLEEVIQISSLLNKRDLSGKETTKLFSSEVAKYIGRRYAIPTSSGTNALFLSLKSLEIKPQDEVILPSYICNSVMHAVQNTSAIPVLADINKTDYNISLEDTKKKITKNTKAIIVPHMFGNPVKDITSFLELGIPIIEDAAQSIGAIHNNKKVGTFGNQSVLSFYATKMMTTGLGGMILTDDESTYKKLQDLTKNDQREKWEEGYSLSMGGLNASLGLAQLPKLDSFVSRRKEIASEYLKLIYKDGIKLPQQNEENIFFRFILESENADLLISSLRKRGINAEKPVYKPLHQYFSISNENLPNTTHAQNQAISIPIYPSLTNNQVREIAGAVSNWRSEK